MRTDDATDRALVDLRIRMIGAQSTGQGISALLGRQVLHGEPRTGGRCSISKITEAGEGPLRGAHFLQELHRTIINRE